MKTVYVPDDLHFKIKKKSLDEDRPMKKIVKELLEKGFEQYG